jgi:DNA gyrase subunit A
MEIGLVRRIDIDEEMQQAYLDYAMSVIVARALPDARDGLKPVHRRILYAMYDMAIRPDSEFRKSARIVGEVLGKYHPHGDMAVYEAMARMAQDFSMRYPLADGQGNFGSIDGDAPAAMRYTEARLAPPAMEMLRDIDRETVDFSDNFDGSLREPTVLPSGLPNLLINGATGIAVGMATSIPPHNLGEVCDALIFVLENWAHTDRITIDELMGFIRGPDFPTGGIIVGSAKEGDGLAAAYGSGRGRISVQARAHVEDMGRGRSRIIVTELPFQTNKATLIERIAELARSGDLEGLADLRDESDRQGMRIVIELTKTAEPEKVLAQLYKRTPMQTTFSLIMLALVDGEPRLLNLKQALRVYLEHRLEVVRRRSEFDLRRARERAHILEGLRLALQHVDDVIKLIRAARDADEARDKLRRRYKLTVIQANAILDMPLRRLASLERKKIEIEYREKVALIKELEGLLASDRKLRQAIAEEIRQIKNEYGDRRRTQIVQLSKGKQAPQALTATAIAELAPEKETWVVLTEDGRISRSPSGRVPRLAGRNAPQLLLGATGRDTLYLFESGGTAVSVAVHTLPEVDDPASGNPVVGATPFQAGAQVVAGIALPRERMVPGAGEAYLVFGTRQGMVKKTPLEALPGPSARPFVAAKIAAGDRLAWVRLTSGRDDLLMVSSVGMAIRFSEDDVRPMGLNTAGVGGMRLESKDAHVIALEVVSPGGELFVVSQTGLAKRTPLTQFPRQGRNGKGVWAWKSGDGDAVCAATVGAADDRAVVHLSRSPARSIRLGDAPRRARTAVGKTIVEVKATDKVSSLTPPSPRPQLAPTPEARASKPKKAANARPRKAAASASPKAKKGKTKAKPSASTSRKKPAVKRPARRRAAGDKPASQRTRPAKTARKPGAKKTS